MQKSDPIPWTCPCCTRSLRPVEKYGHLYVLRDIHWCNIYPHRYNCRANYVFEGLLSTFVVASCFNDLGLQEHLYFDAMSGLQT
jgi:hypothetical protein